MLTKTVEQCFLKYFELLVSKDYFDFVNILFAEDMNNPKVELNSKSNGTTALISVDEVIVPTTRSITPDAFTNTVPRKKMKSGLSMHGQQPTMVSSSTSEDLAPESGDALQVSDRQSVVVPDKPTRRSADRQAIIVPDNSTCHGADPQSVVLNDSTHHGPDTQTVISNDRTRRGADAQSVVSNPRTHRGPDTQTIISNDPTRRGADAQSVVANAQTRLGINTQSIISNIQTHCCTDTQAVVSNDPVGQTSDIGGKERVKSFDVFDDSMSEGTTSFKRPFTPPLPMPESEPTSAKLESTTTTTRRELRSRYVVSHGGADENSPKQNTVRPLPVVTATISSKTSIEDEPEVKRASFRLTNVTPSFDTLIKRLENSTDCPSKKSMPKNNRRVEV